MLNVHPSLLPKYPGLHTHERAIEAGDSHGGVTVHLVTAELDDGPMLGQTPVAILPGDTPDTLAARVLIAEHQLYSRCLEALVSRESSPEWLLSQVEKLALALPEAEPRESHGSPGWRTGGKSGKYFAYFSDQHHGEPHIAVLVKTSGADEMYALAERSPEIYFRPAYYGASGWIGLILNRKGVDWDHFGEWLERSWREVAPKRLTKLLKSFPGPFRSWSPPCLPEAGCSRAPSNGMLSPASSSSGVGSGRACRPGRHQKRAPCEST